MSNIHATALVIGDRGLVILGPSGSGKTTLATALVDHFSRRGKFSRLVGDDQLFVGARGGRAILRVPSTIAGLAEVPGLGPHPVPFEPAAVIDLAIRLIPPGATQRFQEEAAEIVAGCRVPLLVLAERDVVTALVAVPAALAALRFGRD